MEVAPVRPGRRISLTEARMTVDGRAVAVARVWHLATGPTPPASTPVVLPPPLPGPAEAPAVPLPEMGDWGYGKALEWRYTAGSPTSRGPAAVWTRVRVPLVAGEPITPLARVLVAADAANGISAELPLSSWLSIPTGMTTHLFREPDGEWVHLAARSQLSDDGIGLTLGTLSDSRGPIGEVSQPLLVRAR